MLNYNGLLMRILVTNDDGIHSEGLRTLARELSNVARVIVVAPDREQSGIGTAVTLRQPLRIQKIRPLVPEVETYSVDGTPSDSVILALCKLVGDKVDMVVSGINRGLNLGENVLISGTVSAAMQAYLRGFPALAISVTYENSHQHLDTAARIAALLAPKIVADPLLSDIFLNVNLPDVPLSTIRGVKITRLASESHMDTAVEEDDDQQQYYLLVRQRTSKAIGNETDMWAIEQGNISITPLYTRPFDKTTLPALHNLSAGLIKELAKRPPEPDNT